MKDPIPLSRAFSRATRTASGSISPATTGRFRIFAAAKARIPVPVPTSRTRRGLRSLDLDRDVLRAALVPVMGAMDEHSSGTDGLEAFERCFHPILLLQRKEDA